MHFFGPLYHTCTETYENNGWMNITHLLSKKSLYWRLFFVYIHVLHNITSLSKCIITLFKAIIVLCGTDSILQNIPHNQSYPRNIVMALKMLWQTRKKSTSHLFLLCTLMPPIIPLLILMLIHKLYEESNRWDSIYAQQNLSTYPTFVALFAREVWDLIQ